MKAVLQRVRKAAVTVEGKQVGSTGRGLVILLGVREGDFESDVNWLADKCLNLRIFENEEGKFHYSVLDVHGDLLVVSQFTLYGDCRRGRRPSFTEAANPAKAVELYESFVSRLRESGLRVETGIFAARMLVDIANEGPVTVVIDTESA